MQTDVVIIGGGPAGSATAISLARHGINVTLVEQSRFPRRKVCGEYLNCGSLAMLDALGVLPRVMAEANPLLGVRLANPRREIRLAFPSPAASLPRERLDALLLDEAVQAGTSIIRGRATDILIDEDRITGVTIETDDGSRTITARFVVGADGCGSMIARKRGLTRPLKTHARFAVGGHFVSEPGQWLEMSANEHSYLAMNPLPNGLANVMLISPRSHVSQIGGSRNEHVGETMRTLALRNTVCARETLVGKRVAVGPLAHDVRRSSAAGVLLVGDAGGFMSPFTGQGVFMALHSAREAAQTIVASLRDSGCETQASEAYNTRIRSALRSRRAMTDAIDALTRFPAIATHIMKNIDRRSAVQAELMRSFSGLESPEKLLRFDVLRTIIA